MIAPLSSVGSTGAVHVPTEVTGPAKSSDASFAAQLEKAVGSVDSTVQSSDQALASLASGGDVDLHGSMIALQEADIALRGMVAVRDKVVQAYEQLMNLAI
jgi:flagellar hook-basal body complex protein FliE